MTERFFRHYQLKRTVMGVVWLILNLSLVFVSFFWVIYNLMHGISAWLPLGLEVVMGLVSVMCFEPGLEWIDDFLERRG